MVVAKGTEYPCSQGWELHFSFRSESPICTREGYQLYDVMKAWLDETFEMPDNLVALLIREDFLFCAIISSAEVSDTRQKDLKHFAMLPQNHRF